MNWVDIIVVIILIISFFGGLRVADRNPDFRPEDAARGIPAGNHNRLN